MVNQLRSASGLSDWLISTGLFGIVAQWGLGYPAFFKGVDLGDLTGSLKSNWNQALAFAAQEWHGVILGLALYLWFWSYRYHTNAEMDLLDSLYPEGQSPADWGKVTNRRFIRVLAVGIVAVFLLMAALLGSVEIFALAMICLWCQDLLGNEIMRDNLGRILAENPPQLAGDPDLLQLYRARHAAARHYWLVQPQLRRIVLALAATAVALAVAFLPAFLERKFQFTGFGDSQATMVARLLLAGIIIANEATMRRWRTQREAALLEAEIIHDEARSARQAAAQTADPVG